MLRAINFGIDNFFIGDPRLKEWPLMQNPLPGTVMIVAYVYFVKVLGPQYMKTRSPYNLKYVMVLYNFGMVLTNLWLFIEIGWYGWFTNYKFVCQSVDYSNNYDAVRMAELGWWLYVTKFIEFTDTIFFVLRKKNAQISNLHVIHHSIVPFSYWFGFKYAPGGYNSFFPFLNCFVHVVMYAYYGLAAMGPKYRKYLFWKKYMTYIQMVQFVVAFVFCLANLFADCEFAKTFIIIHMMHAMLFLGLFYNFFRKCYTPRVRKKEHETTLSTTTNGELYTVSGVSQIANNKSNGTNRHKND